MSSAEKPLPSPEPPRTSAPRGGPSAGQWRSRAALVGGCAAALLGVVVIAGWHAGSVTLTRVSASYRPMGYLTAVGFLLGGAALAALCLGLRGLARALAGLMAFAAIVRTVEHAFGFHTGMGDLVLGRAGREALGWMAPLTSASFALIGLALLDAARPRAKRRPALEGFAGAIVLGIGAVALFGYAIGDPAYIWGPLTGMALLGAGGLAVLGFSVLVLALEAEGGRALPQWTPLLVLVACLSAALSQWRAFVSDEQESFQAGLQQRADSLASQAASEIQARALALERMARRIESQPDMPRTAWEADARLQFSHYAGFRKIAWTDSGLAVRWAVPPGGGPDDAGAAASRASLQEASQKALRTGVPAVSRVFPVARGSSGLIACAPVWPPGAAPGLIVGVVRLDPLFDSIWSGRIAEGYAIAIADDRGDVYRRGRIAPAGQRGSREARFELGGGGLVLRVWPSPSLLRARSRMPAASLVIGLAGSALLALLLHFSMRSRMRAREAEEARREIEAQARRRDEAAASLARSEARFRAMSEASPLGLFLTNGRKECVYANRVQSEITGLTLEQTLGFGWMRGLHPDDRDRILARWHEATDRGEPFSSTYRFVRPDGSIVWVEGTAVRIEPEDPSSGYVGVIRDVTEAYRSRIELEARTRSAGFAADVGAALTRRETLAAALSDCARAMVGHLGGAAAGIWTLDEGQRTLELQGSAGSGKTPPQLQSRMALDGILGRMVLDRQPRLAAIDRHPLEEEDPDGAPPFGMAGVAGHPLIARNRVVGVMAMFADHPLTEATLQAIASVSDQIALAIDRAQAARALAESESRSRSVMDNMLVGLLTADERGIIESVNPAAERIFGYAASEMVGHRLTLLLPPGTGQDPESFLRDAYDRSVGRVTEWEARRKSGEIFPVELALFTFPTREGPHFAGSVRDISERREVERLKKEFLSMVSHELRTPLTSIRGSLGLLAGGVMGELPAEARDLIAIASRNADRLAGLINDLLDLERLDGGRMRLQVRSVSLSSILARSVESVAGFAEQAQVRIRSSAREARVRGDEDRLVQVVVNLLSNAVKFSSARTTVTVSARELPGFVEVRVEDQGRGIPAPMREAIFERFRQVEASDARRRGGTGLGLAICKRIVELHGGSIGVESEEGRGSTFWFRVPAAAAAVAVAVAQGSRP